MSWGLLFGVAVLMDRSLTNLVHCCRITGKTSYQDLALDTYGKRMLRFLDCCLIFQTFGICVAYLIIIGDLLPSIVGLLTDDDSTGSNRTLLLTIITWLVVFPLAMMRDLNSLRHTSTAAIVAIVYLVILVIVKKFSLDRGAEIEPVNKSIDLVSVSHSCLGSFYEKINERF